MDYIESMTLQEAHKLNESLVVEIKKEFPEYTDRERMWLWTNPANIFHVNSWASYPPSETEEAKWPKTRADAAQKYRRLFSMQTELNQPLYAEIIDCGIGRIWCGNEKKCLLIPDILDYGEFTEERDYSNVSPLSLRIELGEKEDAVSNMLPAAISDSMTHSLLQKDITSADEEMRDLKAKMDETRKGKSEELIDLTKKIEALQAELEAKKEALMEQLEEKKAELEDKMEQMKDQIYLLDSQIYAIRCYAGEIVKFAKIREGKNAPIEEPVILHQKLRFLDEDLGRIASIYTIDWDDLHVFERFLKYSPAALDVFAPNERCIMLVRLSKDGKLISNSDEPYDNMLEDYEYYHGKTVGIIIRNGENLYLGWTDEQRIHIQDDLIISQLVTTTEPVSAHTEFWTKSDERYYLKQRREEARKIIDGIVSRNFVYNILQGVVDHSNILPLPDGVKLNKQSPYVVYAVADRWLADNRFGSFDEIIKKANGKLTKGDIVLTTQSLVAKERTWSSNRTFYGERSWENPRGRGERNRTRNTSIEDCTLYPINLIEFDPPKYSVVFKSHQFKETLTVSKDSWENDYKNREGAEFIKEFSTQDRHVYVSVKMKETVKWEETSARVNFELYDGEYINLTFMNSVWLEWVVNTKNLGGWTANSHHVNYAFAIRYLKTALDFVRKREAKEKELIDAVDPSVTASPEWQVALSNWKLDFNVRQITAYQAKRFVRHFLELSNS